MIKVGIVTIVDDTNYGNRLQNYALYYILRKDFRCKAITLIACEEKRFCNGSYIMWIKNEIVKKLCVFSGFAEKLFGITTIRWANFRNWSKLIPTKYFYLCESLPKSLNDKYDLFIAGSDQIWNYHFSFRKFNDYFLSFAESKKRNAISGSFGVSSLPEEWKTKYIKELSRFANISVREDAGQTIIKELLGIEVPVLIDPSMMLTKDEWLKVSKKPKVDCSKPYVLKYYLGSEVKDDKIDDWAREKGYEIYELFNQKNSALYSAGPGEFISLINNALLVCSDSFHCIVFSIIFCRPFIAYTRQGSEDYMISRIETLLRKFGLQKRWEHSVVEEEYLACDYSLIPQILEKERRQFREYLWQVLNSKV